MAAKHLAFDAEAREAIRTGVTTLARAVKVTLGPRGRNVMIERGYGAPLVTKDGVSVAKEMELELPWEDIGAQLVKEVAAKTADGAGDGTTTATVLAEAIFERGLTALTAGVQPVYLKRGIEKATAAVLEALAAASREVKESKDIAHVASIAANNDEEIGQVLADAMDKVGKDGVITVDEGKGIETTIELVDGMSLDKGYLSPHFVNNRQNLTCELENPYVLLYDGKLTNVHELLPLLEELLGAQGSLLVIAEAVEGEALALLAVNALRGMKVCCVKNPAYGEKRVELLRDVGVLTGGTVVSKDMGVTLEGLTLEDLGRAQRVVAHKEETTIEDGAGERSAIQDRIDFLRREMEAATSDYDRGKLEQRIAKLSGGVARVLVGAATEAEMRQKKARVEDALHATRAAVEEGILPGGGIALLRAAKAIDGVELNEDEQVGATIVRQALEAPLRQIATNAGENPAVVIQTVLKNDSPTFGFNALTLEYGDMLEQGVIDPTRVPRSAFQNAVSVSTLLLTTDAIVGEREKPDEHAEDEHMH
ncbi:MAG: chaperonin GroEL [Planctomycetota bacterium]